MNIDASTLITADELAMIDAIAEAFAAMPAGMSGPFDGCLPVPDLAVEEAPDASSTNG